MYRCIHMNPDGLMTCTATATHRLCDSRDKRVPGARYCQAHAQDVLDEYADRLGWHWTATPLNAGGVMLEPHKNPRETV